MSFRALLPPESVQIAGATLYAWDCNPRSGDLPATLTIVPAGSSVPAHRATVRLNDPVHRSKYAHAASGQNGVSSTPADIEQGLVALAQQVDAKVRVTGTLDPYVVDGGCLCWQRRDSTGAVVLSPLANFEARIAAEVVLDDGAMEAREFEITGTLASGRQLPAITVATGRFTRMEWPVEQWGAQAILAAGPSTRDRAREAIQTLSYAAGPVPERRRYVAPGWRGPVLGAGFGSSGPVSTPFFVHAAGSVGPVGPVGPVFPGVEVALSRALSHVVLPDPPTDAALHAAVRASLDLLELAPESIMAPVLGAVYRAPLCHLQPSDLVIHLVGESVTFKSEIAALAQQHYGAGFTRLNLPQNWASTPNALERSLYEGKDVLTVIDDFAPSGSPVEVARYHAVAERIIRSAGNRQARGRLSRDGHLQADLPPRGQILMTGEDIPRGQSIRARMGIVPVARGDVAEDDLTVAQQRARSGEYAAAIAAYVQWLASRLDALAVELPTIQAELRARAQQPGIHRRLPDAISNLGMAWVVFLRFAHESGAITASENDRLWERVWRGLGQLALEQSQHQADQDAVEQFLQLLSSAIVAGRGYLADPDGTPPPDGVSWGWRAIDREDVLGNVERELHPRGDKIGWIRADDVYLDSNSAYACVQKLARDGGTSLPVTLGVLEKRLHQRGHLKSTEVRGGETRLRVRRTAEGRRIGVLHLDRATFHHEGTDGFPAQPAQPAQSAVEQAPLPGVAVPPPPAESGPVSAASGEKPAPKTGPTGPICCAQCGVVSAATAPHGIPLCDMCATFYPVNAAGGDVDEPAL